jgi:hypothetical protein
MNNDSREYNGLIFCKILPPNDLYFPVLPIRLNNRLIFPLCHECAVNLNNQNCNHSESQRALVGTYTTMELKKALELNYRILEIYEVWNYPELLPINEADNGIFTQFINDFIKIKVQASGWPKDDMNESEKIEYIRLFEEKEGISLDINQIIITQA